MSFYSGHPDPNEAQLSMIPICDATVACFEYNGGDNEGTDFQAAGLSVNVLRGARTEQDCRKTDRGSDLIKTVKINGVRFHFDDADEVAAGTSMGGTLYSVFYQSVCFEIAVETVWTSSGFEDMPRFEAAKEKRILDNLDKMLHTFKFVGPVKDGPGWKVYNDNECGGGFEYPEGATIRKAVEYSSARLYSNDITCSQYFTYHGLDYTVAVKLNLKDANQLDAWLASSGYPGLEQVQVVARTKTCTEYAGGSYFYIFGRGEVYIMSVSDADHKLVNSDADPVFRHLQDSVTME